MLWSLSPRLYYFYFACRYANFAKAAKVAGCSTANVMLSVRALEATVGHRLVSYLTKKQEQHLTDAGHVMYKTVQVMLSFLDEAEQELKCLA